jgi:hypothetical protein
VGEDELSVLVSEHMAYHRKRGSDASAIRQATKQLGDLARDLRRHGNTPLGLRLRHVILEDNFFNPLMQNTHQLELLDEPDPVRLHDAETHKLMTRRDVVALANLAQFARSDQAPRHQGLSDAEVNQMVQYLRDNARVRLFLSETAILWAGILQQWPHLSAEERRQTRAYLHEAKELSPAMTTKLLARAPAGPNPAKSGLDKALDEQAEAMGLVMGSSRLSRRIMSY